MPFHPAAGAGPVRRASGWNRVGADLHRAVREPHHGCVLGVPAADLDRPDLHRQRIGRSRHGQPVLADLPVRLADPPDRALPRSLGTGPADGRVARALVLPQSGRPHHRSRPAGRTRAHRVLGRRRRLGLGLARALLRLSAAVLDRGAARPRLPRSRRARHRLDLGARPGLARRRAVLPAQPGSRALCQPAGPGGLRRGLRGVLGRPAPRSAVLVRRLPGRDVSADRQCRRPCRRRPGLAARGPAPGLPAAPARPRLGHVRLRGRSAGAIRCR